MMLNFHYFLIILMLENEKKNNHNTTAVRNSDKIVLKLNFQSR